MESKRNKKDGEIMHKGGGSLHSLAKRSGEGKQKTPGDLYREGSTRKELKKKRNRH